MFDLDQHVRSWRQAAAGTLGNDAQILDELEAHLRDEFDRLIACGQSADDAWAAAVQKLGNPRNLAGEFAKLHHRHWIPAWVATGSLALVVAALTWFMIARLAAGAFRPLLAIHIVLITAGYVAVFAAGFLGVYAVLIRAIAGWNDHQDAALRTTGARIALFAVVTTLLGVTLGAWWARENLGRWWAWDPKEIGGICVLAWSWVLYRCFRSWHSTPQARMCIAVMGNMVVALAWFGPVLPPGLHTYGDPSSLGGMLLGGFLIAQMLVIYLTLLPAGVLRPGRFRAAGEK
ncbi:MAG: cytochrome biosis protein [Phycisphaerales bacterium]|nr:cytochrome biosis protein [Phycisphaerales bacterium]MDB5354695.1 cytochrome biosis protein [Phycisphaerales bacterium]